MSSYLTKLPFNHKPCSSLGAEVRLFRLAEQLLAAVHLLRLPQVKPASGKAQREQMIIQLKTEWLF